MLKRDIKMFIYSCLMGIGFVGMCIFGGSGSIKFTLLSIVILLGSKRLYNYHKDISNYKHNRLYQGNAIL